MKKNIIKTRSKNVSASMGPIIIVSLLFFLFSAISHANNPAPKLLDIQFSESYQLKKLYFQKGDLVKTGDLIALLKNLSHGGTAEVRADQTGTLAQINFREFDNIPGGSTVFILETSPIRVQEYLSNDKVYKSSSLKKLYFQLWESTGIASIIKYLSHSFQDSAGKIIMILVGLLLLYLAIVKKFEPLLLVPIGFGCILCNIPESGFNDPGGMLYYIYQVGIHTGVFPLIIFMGVGALTDFGPMIAHPKTALLGGAAQFGIFITLMGAILISKWIPGIDFDLKDASAIAIIGGADGPTAIFLASKLSPRLLGSIAVAAYSYMALVPLIQPPIMRALTTKEERQIIMSQLRTVSKKEKIIFPLSVLALCALLLPSAAPLIGMFMFGNLMRECMVVERLSQTAQNALINIVTIFLGLGVGSKLSADKFLNLETLGILLLGVIAFSVGTAGGILMAKFINLFSKNKINPLIGSAGVSAVPMAARVSNNEGLRENPQNFLLFHAMGPNVSGVIGSAVAAGILLAVFQ